MSVFLSGLSNAFVTLLKGTRDTTNAITELSAKSLVEMSGSAQVEPITAIDSTLVPYDALTDVLKLVNSLFASYYLSAGSVSTHVGRIDTVKLLDRLNPTRSVSFNIANSILLDGAISALEDYSEAQQPAINPHGFTLPRASMEDDGKSQTAQAYGELVGNARVSSSSSGTDLLTVSNLSIGQLVKFNIEDGGKARAIDVTIRLIAYPTTPRVLRTILTWGEKDMRIKSRIRAFTAGELSFWRDLVFMRDIFVARRRAFLDDKSGLLQSLSARVNRNILAGVASLTPSAGTVSSILVVSEDTLRDIESELNGELSDFKTRQRVMNATGLMIIAVVDPIEEFVTIHTYSKKMSSTYSFKQIKSASKGGASELMEMIKLMSAGSMANTF